MQATIMSICSPTICTKNTDYQRYFYTVVISDNSIMWGLLMQRKCRSDDAIRWTAVTSLFFHEYIVDIVNWNFHIKICIYHFCVSCNNIRPSETGIQFGNRLSHVNAFDRVANVCVIFNAQRYASAVDAMLCACMCLSVTSRRSIIMAKYITAQTLKFQWGLSPTGTSNTRRGDITVRSSPMGAWNTRHGEIPVGSSPRRVAKISDFQQITRYIWKRHKER